MSRILMVASEAAPYAKTGGLADVVGALPFSLAALGHEVAVVLPRYRSIPLEGLERVWDRLLVFLGPHAIEADIWRRVTAGVQFYFVDCPWLFDRPGGLYGDATAAFPDNHLRFALFANAALGVCRFLFRPDILHLHDWQAALCAPYVRTRFASEDAFANTKIVFTIHNLEYQGRFGASVYGDLGLDPWLFQPAFLEYFGDVSFMKGGILFADAVTTVSPRYAEEIQTPEFGSGLDGLLRAHSSKIHGVLNGVDYSEWSPEVDPFLAARYSATDLSGKQLCKHDLLAEMGLPPENRDRPVLGLVSRFASQKGMDILAGMVWELMNDDVCLTILGSGDRHSEDFFRHLAAVFPDRVAAHIGFNNRLAHKIEAGADMFLMPSNFEPCGLNQMYSLRYGTVPIVRSTGGLENTVDGETGFKFWGYWPGDFLAAVRAALDEYRNRPDEWGTRMRTGMRRDFSWAASARQYSDLYASL